MLILAGVGPRQTQGRHDRFRAGHGKSHQFGGWHHAADPRRHRVFQLGRQGEHAAGRHALLGRLVNPRVGVA